MADHESGRDIFSEMAVMSLVEDLFSPDKGSVTSRLTGRSYISGKPKNPAPWAHDAVNVTKIPPVQSPDGMQPERYIIGLHPTDSEELPWVYEIKGGELTPLGEEADENLSIDPDDVAYLREALTDTEFSEGDSRAACNTADRNHQATVRVSSLLLEGQVMGGLSAHE